jgi:hypothetical protein
MPAHHKQRVITLPRLPIKTYVPTDVIGTFRRESAPSLLHPNIRLQNISDVTAIMGDEHGSVRVRQR